MTLTNLASLGQYFFHVVILMIFYLFLFLTGYLVSASIIYAPDGTWGKAEKPELCTDQFLCAPGNLTWKSRNNPTLFNVNNVCDALVEAGITSIDFHGDSYMRQIYAAILITLNGNYRNGSIADTEYAKQNGAAECVYHTQFAEKHCGVRSLNHGPRVCDGRVQLDPLLNGVENLDKCRKAGNGSIVLFSWGNYKVGNGGHRSGVNNPKLYAKFFEESGLCPSIRKRDEALAAKQQQLLSQASATEKNRRALKNKSIRASCGVYWISTHYRLVAHFPDEKEEIVKAYNDGMRDFFSSGKCGNVNYIDVYNMTAAFGINHHSIATGLSYDQVHWGMEINLLKAQTILNALVSDVSVTRR